MRSLIFLAIVLLSTHLASAQNPCNATTCSQCLANAPTCAWCATAVSSSVACIRNNATASLACPNRLITDNCQTDCQDKVTCVECVLSVATCVFCETSQMCIPGGLSGPSHDLGFTCPAWKTLQCYVTGLLAIIIVCSVAAAVIVIIVVCCCCCWCRRRRRAREAALLEDRDDHTPKARTMEEIAPKTTARRRELELKYGLKPNV
eukprot:TRINITY_DN3637_c0_g1_i2.p1 TRINITY_DN3637_c0_g1~~TRINITY_DN3637_c0_g1_i2.p1  ORF type:complete len:205 (-),score=11.83 TRINITY_DN3637_c0_g1_i2:40-654(-)